MALVVGLLLVTGLLAGVPANAGVTGSGSADRVKPQRPPQDPSAITTFARSSLLCTGYIGCNQAGMGNAGYRQANSTMYWQMYSGHNCTNYAAYRMVRSGMPNSRPWSGGGNATYWGGYNPKITDGVPAVGAVAWWKANVRPAGSAGHVAYVEQVVSADEIIVSQDSWGGDFSWARLTRTGGSWPSGFVHFNDVVLRNTTKSSVAGTAKVGGLLTAQPGAWSPSPATFTYHWRANGVGITGATRATFRPTAAVQGKRISVRVVASRTGYPAASSISNPTPAVGPGQISASVAPVVSGDARVDAQLTASSGTWVPTPTSVAYQWSADGVPIPGATGATLTPGPDLVGKTLNVTVTASKNGYDDVAVSSVPTSAVALATFTALGSPVLTGSPRLGETLSIDPGRYAPTAASSAVTWVRDGVPIDGASGTTYVLTEADLGARVWAKVTLTRPGYRTLTTRSGRTWPVKSVSTLRVAAHAGKGRLRVDVSVTAPGVAEVVGVVVIKSHGKVIGQVSLAGGRGVLTLADLPTGRAVYEFRYLGGDTTTPTANKSRSVWIR